MGPYSKPIKNIEEDIKKISKHINDVCGTLQPKCLLNAFNSFLFFFLSGIKESDTGLSPPSVWDLVADKQMMQEEQPLLVRKLSKIREHLV